MINHVKMYRFNNLLKHFSTSGLVFATFLFALSLTPSLVPRPYIAQGIVSGLSFTIGYAFGVLGHWLWNYLHLPSAKQSTQRYIQLALAAISLCISILFLWRASEWQNSIRTLMGMEPEDSTRPFTIAAITLAVFAVALLFAKLFKIIFYYLSKRMSRFLPSHVSHVLGIVMVTALFWSIIEGLVYSYALQVADRSYQHADQLIQDDLHPPLDPNKPGSAESLISWEALGSRGRHFVVQSPSSEDISRFTDKPALDPIRVYVGLNAAETPELRAQLALDELIRVGGFERSVLIIATPTGRGWIDPRSQDAVEYLHQGDIATVAAQYSYLPSHLSLIAEGQYGAENARALFNTLYSYWTSLPKDSRPKLYLFGLSLGALNSDLSFDLYDIIEDPFNGALWSGPPFRSVTWRNVTRNRDPDSPAWLPSFRQGSVVRFMNQTQGLDLNGQPWGDFRIAFLQYGSDPITFFEPAAFWRKPEWMQEPRAPDVSPYLSWYPIVTMLQLMVDLSIGSAPPGFGHEISTSDYIKAWAALSDSTWSIESLEQLAQHLIQLSELRANSLEPRQLD
ncbi:hypothetical protein DN062_11175 [Nitrincola tibetensis]|uniref:Alpha/beta-hydrolase catalytic domain-containing protein n=2 Tax=Nitrincola tibetensis TaxID=2219697 RepID=A0A364NLD7_9GAMM|nr:hypothetical protein DN062_11175 [Nitrincola tibetensis]